MLDRMSVSEQVVVGIVMFGFIGELFFGKRAFHCLSSQYLNVRELIVT